ncbi:MAG: hypothetical protein B6I36_07700 [Desulfobacteraceae bacterium 4572_35.1]|nr:MAG: hypothetical protein B6I36_07700 [Desulfobacteraceae bacterium 4572_35.1]
MIAGDTLPTMTGQLTDDDGSVIDISSYTITLHIKYDTPKVVPAVVTDAANGKYEIQWSADDFVKGKWKFELQITDSNGAIQTVNRHEDNDRLLEFIVDGEVA